MEKTRRAEAKEGARETEQRIQHARSPRLQYKCQIRAAPSAGRAFVHLLGCIKLQSNLISIIQLGGQFFLASVSERSRTKHSPVLIMATVYCNLSNHRLSLTVCVTVRWLIVGVVGIALHTEQVVLCAFTWLQTLVTSGGSTSVRERRRCPSLSQRDGGIKAQPLKDTAVLWGLQHLCFQASEAQSIKAGGKVNQTKIMFPNTPFSKSTPECNKVASVGGP